MVMQNPFQRLLRSILLLILMASLTGCFYWWRTYQTYRQLSYFDENFSITNTDSFALNFKKPRLYSEDFVSLAKLRPTSEEKIEQGLLWQYDFNKVDAKGVLVSPEISFFVNLAFNQDDHIVSCTFSPLFLQIIPAEFLEISIRSVAKGEINKQSRQLKVDTAKVDKISSALPLKQAIVAKLGEPAEVTETKLEHIYIYHFLLNAHDIEDGYEDRALNVIKLYFNKASDEMVKMSGSFAGLKISIDYRNYKK